MDSKLNRIIAFLCWFSLGVLGFTSCSTAAKKAKNQSADKEDSAVIGTKADTTSTAPKDSTSQKAEGTPPKVEPRIRLLYGVPPTRYMEKLPDEMK